MGTAMITLIIAVFVFYILITLTIILRFGIKCCVKFGNR
jgi:hypothetical protein